MEQHGRPRPRARPGPPRCTDGSGPRQLHRHGRVLVPRHGRGLPRRAHLRVRALLQSAQPSWSGCSFSRATPTAPLHPRCAERMSSRSSQGVRALARHVSSSSARSQRLPPASSTREHEPCPPVLLKRWRPSTAPCVPLEAKRRSMCGGGQARATFCVFLPSIGASMGPLGGGRCFSARGAPGTPVTAMPCEKAGPATSIQSKWPGLTSASSRADLAREPLGCVSEQTTIPSMPSDVMYSTRGVFSLQRRGFVLARCTEDSGA
mmetsp:Transcript_106331/g.300845  ORF Transcript_106331/g.300845 Transcript_106331/m.300845 type:complete len:263 (+) Transcript_106331:148-936(+)